MQHTNKTQKRLFPPLLAQTGPPVITEGQVRGRVGLRGLVYQQARRMMVSALSPQS